jgi:hypothetical protein
LPLALMTTFPQSRRSGGHEIFSQTRVSQRIFLSWTLRRSQNILTDRTFPEGIFIFDSPEVRWKDQSANWSRGWGKIGWRKRPTFSFYIHFLTYKENSCSKNILPTNQADDQMGEKMVILTVFLPTRK